MANTRQEVVNTFDKGMIKDLNPINTPANVLTDCLNGTYITYDGNEFQLQNDRGNISLKYSKLREGYLPVGTTSYGDILYIVSYNPLENRTQIGTFPSPKLLSNYDHNCDLENPSILTQEGDDVIKYTEAIDKHQQLVVYFGDKDELIINPGDQYNIEPPGEYVEDFEKLEYFIFTENKELINITDLVIPDAQYHYVKWKVPGYFATRWRLPQINENGFSVRTKSITLKDPATATINCQIASDDELIDNLYEKHELFSIELENTEGAVKDNKSLMEDRIIYDSVNYYNTDIKCKVEVEKDDTGKYVKDYQTFLAPYAEGSKKLLFDQFIQASEAIDLNNTFNPENTHIADEYYNYTVNDNKATVNFNIDCSVVSEGEVGLYIDYVPLYKYINNGYSVEGLFSDSDDRDNVFDGIGQNIVELTFDQPEQIYLLRIEMSDGITDPVYCYKILICSEFMNEFDKEEYPDFETIVMDQWLHYLCELHFDFKINSLGNVQQGEMYHWNNCNMSDHFWISEDVTTITGFVPEKHEDKIKIDTWQCGYTYHITNIDLNYTVRQKYLYNFCIAEYYNSKIELLDRNVSISSGEESSNNIVGNTDTNCYIERKYTDQNKYTTSGAMFDFREVVNGRDLLVVNINHGESTEEGEQTTKSTISVDVENWKNLSTDFYVQSISVPTVLYFDMKGYAPEKIENLLPSNVLYDTKKIEQVIVIEKDVKAAILRVLNKEFAACIPGVIRIRQSVIEKTVGISTNFFGTWARKNNPGIAVGCVFGLFFKTSDAKPFFLPLIPMYKYMTLEDNITEDGFKYGWDYGAAYDSSWEHPYLVNKDVYDWIIKFANKLLVNIKNSSFEDGYFLNRSLLEENIIDTLNLNVKYNTSLSSLLLKGTDDVCRLSANWTFSDERLEKMFTANWNSAKDFSGSEVVLSDEKICSFSDKSSWPYVATDLHTFWSLEEIEEMYFDKNEIIKQQSENWPNSNQYENVSSGTSIGFYSKNADNDLLNDFLKNIRSTYNSDSVIYNNKSTISPGKVCIDISADEVEEFWAFSIADRKRNNHDFDFTDFDREKYNDDPRFPVFVCWTAEKADIIDILNEEEEDEIEP